MATHNPRPDSDPPPSASPRSGSGLRRNEPARKGRILIAEADAAARAWLLPILRPLALEVVEATSGNELNRRLGEQSFDLVVCGARLPAPSGIAVLARVRARGGSTPFIVVTSFLESRVCVFVSDAEGTVLSSRVVDGPTLAGLAGRLLGSTPTRPPSSIR